MTAAQFLKKYGDSGTASGVFETDFRETLREIFDEIERRAEAKMLEGHRLEGQHYAAMRAVRKELGCERKKS